MWKYETKGGPYSETVRFGDLAWKVLDKSSDGGKVLLISEGIVEERPYHEGEDAGPDLTWESSDIRAYLNGEFADIHFSAEEKARICDTELENRDNPMFGTKGGNDTVDKVFLLSIEEAQEYEYVGNLLVSGELWWLRSPSGPRARVAMRRRSSATSTRRVRTGRRLACARGRTTAPRHHMAYVPRCG